MHIYISCVRACVCVVQQQTKTKTLSLSGENKPKRRRPSLHVRGYFEKTDTFLSFTRKRRICFWKKQKLPPEWRKQSWHLLIMDAFTFVCDCATECSTSPSTQTQPASPSASSDREEEEVLLQLFPGFWLADVGLSWPTGQVKCPFLKIAGHV